LSAVEWFEGFNPDITFRIKGKVPYDNLVVELDDNDVWQVRTDTRWRGEPRTWHFDTLDAAKTYVELIGEEYKR
jgi:hypothetical protein